MNVRTIMAPAARPAAKQDEKASLYRMLAELMSVLYKFNIPAAERSELVAAVEGPRGDIVARPAE
ncbi:MAG TPA: hypothetical protein VI732_01540 [Alphaproteobacteria bacterium]|nr:hypothetical protein [Alphaproteobacteria bacterium]